MAAIRSLAVKLVPAVTDPKQTFADLPTNSVVDVGGMLVRLFVESPSDISALGIESVVRSICISVSLIKGLCEVVHSIIGSSLA